MANPALLPTPRISLFAHQTQIEVNRMYDLEWSGELVFLYIVSELYPSHVMDKNSRKITS